jgi:hypothetical protein
MTAGGSIAACLAYLVLAVVAIAIVRMRAVISIMSGIHDTTAKACQSQCCNCQSNDLLHVSSPESPEVVGTTIERFRRPMGGIRV